jgi:hypothetical protein
MADNPGHDFPDDAITVGAAVLLAQRYSSA